MWECNYANEPADFKLIWLLFLKKIWIFFGAVLAGALLIGGGHFVRHTVFSPEDTFKAVGEVYVDYVWEDAYGISRHYLNESVWATLVKTDLIVDNVMDRLALEDVQADREYVRESMEAALVSDSRIVTTTVTTKDAALSVAVSLALQEALLDFGKAQEGIEQIRIFTSPEEAKKVVFDFKTVRMSVLGAILGGLVSLAGLLLWITLDDSVHIPSTFERRYHIPMLGTLSSKEFPENLKYLCRDCKNIAVASIAEDTSTESVVESIKEKLASEEHAEQMDTGNFPVLSAFGCILEETKNISSLRESDGIILIIPAGRRNGKKIERTLDFLKIQDCPPTAAILWNEDKSLLKHYYK